ncbi:hypothetical protein H5410_004706 [Solanum commersonii]|uniref:Uncharacterized protein n=1 Tax=Solanum commersonii TaxID=4109 RepID=A0A9J6A532_SOLCO|nr:hypothetical protein H5410_004706 [Solanum commersonii]
MATNLAVYGAKLTASSINERRPFHEVKLLKETIQKLLSSLFVWKKTIHETRSRYPFGCAQGKTPAPMQ